MTEFSANLGLLWTGRPLADAIRAAAAAGFDAVEAQWPHALPASEVRKALDETGLPMLGINTRRGRRGERGLCALPGREAEARAEIDATLSFARAIGAQSVHVMAGTASGPAAEAAFRSNLLYASDSAPDLMLLIEPLNHHDNPGYFLSRAEHAAEILVSLGRPNLRMMFDCYHQQIMGGNLSRRLEAHLPLIGHIQIASVPDRGTPDHGELDYRHIVALLRDLGWRRPLGAEYQDPRPTEETLCWMADLRAGACV